MRARSNKMMIGALLLVACNQRSPPPAAKAKSTEELLAQIRWEPGRIDWSKPPALVTETEPGYAGSAACTPCHKAIAQKWSRHSMARSGVRQIDDAMAVSLRAAFDSGQVVLHRSSLLKYRPFRKGDQFFVEELLEAPDGTRLHSWTQPITHTFTSGTFGLAFGFQQGPFVYQVPIDWYTGIKQFGIDPGYKHNMRFRLPLATSCISCHSDYPRHPRGNEAVWRAPLPSGVGCERCHGPGAKHVESADKADIVNPAHLSQRLQLDVCAQCHLEGAAENLRAGRDYFSYRPGETLTSYRMNYIEKEAQPDWFRVTDHSERMSRSACFKRSAGKMVCTTCHDAHQTSLDMSRAAWRVGCLKCHQESACTGPMAERSVNGDDCAQCHMRRDTPDDFRMTAPGIPLPISDHFIRKRISPPRPMGTPIKPLSEPMVPYADRFGEIASGNDLPALYGMAFHLTGRDREALPHLVQGVAAGGMVRRALELVSQEYQTLYSGRSRTAEARQRATEGCRQSRIAVLRAAPDDAEALIDYAKAIATTGGAADDPEALAALDRALRVVPDHPIALQEKAGALFRAGRRDEALPLLQRAAAAGPDQLQALVLLAVNDRDAGRLEAAAVQFEQALLRIPLDRWLLRQLDLLYAKLGPADRVARIARLSAAAEKMNPGHMPSPCIAFLPRETR